MSRSEIDWAAERSRNGGADEVPLPDGATSGRLWLCGKHFIGADVEVALQKTGATHVVCLNQEHEIGERYPAYVEWLRAHAGDRALWYPVPDLHAPDLDRARELLAALRCRLDDGETLLVHCGAGIGRAGTVAAALLVSMGVALDDAIATVAASRPMAGPEAGAQLDLLTAIARSVGGA